MDTWNWWVLSKSYGQNSGGQHVKKKKNREMELLREVLKILSVLHLINTYVEKI